MVQRHEDNNRGNSYLQFAPIHTITNIYLLAKIQTNLNVNLSKKSSFLLDDLASLSAPGRFHSQIGQEVRTSSRVTQLGRKYLTLRESQPQAC